VKLQEELKSARSAIKSTEEMLDLEKERSKTREQEAFAARYSLVGVQEQLEQTLERLKILEQERDAFKAFAKNEEDIARIAAEGRLPLPPSESSPEEDEFASPKKKRVSSISVADIKSSATSEAEIDELTWLWQWEKQRANRALEHVEFLEAECQLRCCACAKSRPRSSTVGARRKRPDPQKITDAGDLVILSEDAHASLAETKASPSPKKSKTAMLRTEEKPKETRRSTIFIPTEGIFRTVSQQEAEAEAMEEAPTPTESPVEDTSIEPPTPADSNPDPSCYARTPSVDPPAFAVVAQQRTSLLSLLDAPHRHDDNRTVFNIPTTPGPVPNPAVDTKHEPEQPPSADDVTPTQRTPLAVVADPNINNQQPPTTTEMDPHDRPHTAAAFYTTTTKVPLRDENADPNLAARLAAQLRTPSSSSSGAKGAGDVPSFDATNPAMTPTMTREQALAQIRARRGRARSAAQGMATPRRQMVEGVERRDVSAPTGRVGRVPSVVRGTRS